MSQSELEAAQKENAKLRKINQALIERLESGAVQLANPYSAFEHSVTLAEQVRERTDALNQALEKLNVSHRELSEANQVAEQANLSKTKFLAAVSHDLLQPLNAARLFATTLTEQPLDDRPKSLVDSLSRSLNDVENLLRTLVDISKLDAGVVHADKTDIRVAPILEQLSTEFRTAAKYAGLRFKHRTCNAWVHSDSLLLIRLLRNLLTNAIRYTKSGGVLLSARRRGTKLLIQVWDTGEGISQEDQSTIFEEFKRLPNADKAHDKGLGLGLSIVDKIAKVLGHTLTVTSTLGKGSVFSLEIPILNRGQEPTADHSHLQPSLPSSLQGKQILVIDNDATICEAMSQLLIHWGAEVMTSLNGEELEKELDFGSVDLLIVDYHLDQGNGIDLAKRLLGETSIDIPVLVVTANHSQTLNETIRREGFSLLHKPLKPLLFRQRLRQLLG